MKVPKQKPARQDTIATLGLCQLLGSDFTLQEILVYSLEDFLTSHTDLVFPHRHSFYQLVYFAKGGGTHTIDFETYSVLPGQVYLMKPGQVHSWRFKPGTDGYLVNFSESFFGAAYINPDFLARFPFFDSEPSNFVKNLSSREQKLVTPLFRSILAENTISDQYRNDALRAGLLRLFITLAREQQAETVPYKSGHPLVLLRNFKKLADEYYREKRTPKEYASLLFVTPNYLNSICKKHLGKAAGALVRDRVILEAKRMLVNSGWTVAQVARHLHFSDNSYFVRFFRKQTGSTPEEFRQSKWNLREYN